jgi:hypothetical protein
VVRDNAETEAKIVLLRHALHTATTERALREERVVQTPCVYSSISLEYNQSLQTLSCAIAMLMSLFLATHSCGSPHILVYRLFLVTLPCQ